MFVYPFVLKHLVKEQPGSSMPIKATTLLAKHQKIGHIYCPIHLF